MISIDECYVHVSRVVPRVILENLYNVYKNFDHLGMKLSKQKTFVSKVYTATF